jgi:AcrR family transcriptional regulator
MQQVASFLTIDENRHMRTASHLRPEIYQRILGEAERLFRTLGYGKTTIADIAAACRMSSANVYRYFENKAAINEAIARCLLHRIEAISMAIAEEDTRPAAERLKQLVLEQHRYTCEQYLQESKVHEMVIKAMDEQWPVIDAHIERLRGCYERVLQSGVDRGEFAAEAVTAYRHCVFNAVIPFAHPQVVAERYANDQGAQAHAMADFLIHALGAD